MENPRVTKQELKEKTTREEKVLKKATVSELNKLTGKKISLNKDGSVNVTNEKSKGEVIAFIRAYSKDAEMTEEELRVTIAKNDKFWKLGVVGVTMEIDGKEKTVYVQCDVLIGVIQKSYAKTIISLEDRALRRKQMAKIYGVIRAKGYKWFKFIKGSFTSETNHK